MMLDLSAILRPTLLLDESICRTNIGFMRDRAWAAGVLFRPHMKTAQSIHIGRWFREAGVDAITVSSVGMARYFADAGWDDITIALPFNIRELESVKAFPAKVKLNLLVESAAVVDLLANGLQRETDIWIKLDTGYGRTGVAHDNDAELDALLRNIERAPRLRLRGLLTHAGMTYSATGPAHVRELFERSRLRLLDAADRHRRGRQLLCSAGDTPGCTLAASFDGLAEIRPGNMTFYDLMQMRIGVCAAPSIAVAVACPVVAVHPERGEAVLYAGAVHLSKDSIPADDGTPMYGAICELDDTGWSEPIEGAWIRSLSQEHGIARLPERLLHTIRPGDLLAVLPVHSCLTAEALRGYLTLDGTQVDHYAAQRPFN